MSNNNKNTTLRNETKENKVNGEGGGKKRAVSYYPAGAKFNKMLLFTIKRSQKQLESTAYKFTLSLKNFTAVCIEVVHPFFLFRFASSLFLPTLTNYLVSSDACLVFSLIFSC